MKYDLLQIFAELGIAFAGFSAILLVLRTRRSEDDDLQKKMVISVVEGGLMSSLFAVLPQLVTDFFASESTTVRFCSSLFSVYWVYRVISGYRNYRGGDAQRLKIGRVHLYVYTFISLLTLALLVLLTFDRLPYAASLYCIAVAFMLINNGNLLLIYLHRWSKEDDAT